MIKLAKYLKPFIGSLVLCVALLFGQAICDLNLPNLMSDIVNVGIQQNGIEHAALEAVSANGMKLMKTFMNQADGEAVDKAYSLVTAGSNEALVKKYPLAASADIYVRNGVSDQELNSLDAIFASSAGTMMNVAKAMGQGAGSSDANSSSMDLNKLYAAQPMLEQLPQEQLDMAAETAAASGATMMNQVGVVFTKGFYQELGMDIAAIEYAYILKIGMLMLLIALAGGVATVMVGFLASRISAGVARSLRRDVFNKVEDFGNDEFDRFSTASLITRTTNDITQMQMLLMMGIRMVCYAPIMAIGGITMALNKSVSMSWVIALAVVVLIGMILVIFSVAMPKFKMMQKLIDRLNLVARENLNGLTVIRAFGTQKFEQERFAEANGNLTKTQLFTNRTMVVMMPAMTLIMNGVTLLIVWVGAKQISESNMQVGDMMAFMQYAMQIIMSFLMISMMSIMIPRAAVSGDRIQEVLATEPSIQDAANTASFRQDKTGWVEFKDVSFQYSGADENVLEHITFTAMPGQTTAFIGSTGSGKSTLINLIPRFYDVTGGQVLVNGTDVRDVNQHELRDQIGYVPQKGVLLSGTIESNLRYGKRDADENQIQTAARIAQAMEFIDSKPEGFDSPVAQGGGNVSGGQKQRLSIARALAKNAPIYIFDDSFSALDFKTDSALRKALKENTGHSTMLIVAQRVSTIMNAEQIIVLDEGKVVGIGTHQELLKNCPTYYEIASSQLSKEELA